jgi:hypothetical protein
MHNIFSAFFFFNADSSGDAQNNILKRAMTAEN